MINNARLYLLTLLPSSAVLLISTTALFGWLMGDPALFHLSADWAPMKFNVAICLWVLTISLLSYQFLGHGTAKMLLRVSSVLVLAAAFFLAAESALSLNLNWLDIDHLLVPNYSNLRQVAPNTIFALVLLSLITLSFSIRSFAGFFTGLVIRTVSVIVILLGLLAVLGHWLSFEYLSSWTGGINTSVLTAFSLLLLGVTSFGLSIQSEAKSGDSEFSSVRKVYLTVLTFMLLIGVLSSIVTFSVLAQRTEQLLAKSQLQLHTDRAYFFNVAIAARSERALVAARDPHIAELLSSLNRNPDDTEAYRALFLLTSPLVENGFSAIAFEAANGRRWEVVENLKSGDITKLPLLGRYSGELVWHSGFWLFSKTPLKDQQGTHVGYMVTEQALVSLNELRESILESSNTGEMVLCSNAGDQLNCFPSARESTPFKIEKFHKNQRLPMSHALDLMESGIKTTFDYRGKRVIAAYGPIANTGLGMVIKIDVDEIYAPIREQLNKVLLFLMGLIGIGFLLIRQRVLPILHQITDARKSADIEKARFIAAAEGGFDAFYIFDAVRDRAGNIADFRCVFVNQIGARLISREPQQFMGRLLCEELPYTREPMYFDVFKQVVETGKPVQEEFHVDHPELAAKWLARQIIKLGDGIALTARDITTKKQTELALKEAERLQSAIVDSASYSIIATDVRGTIISMNKAAQRMLWYDKDELVGKATPLIIHDKDEVVIRAKELSNQLGRTIQPGFEVFTAQIGDDLPEEREWTYIRKDGSRFSVKLSVTELRDHTSSVVGYLGVAFDITEQKRTEEYIRHIALHDVLTGLPNRALFDDRVKVALETAKREKQKLAIALLDLDHFKHINDSLGHHIGDKLLEEVSARLTANLRPSDTVARMGGDEFAFVLPNITHPQGTAVVFDKIIKAFKPLVIVGNHKLHISASIGVCAYPDDGNDQATLIRNADTAMYRAKELGRNHYQIFNEEMEQKASKRLKLESDLRDALSNKTFELFYQPQLDFKSRQIVGFEALLRWQRMPGQYVSPLEFIPIAENSGLIVPIGEWVIRNACEQAAIFKRKLLKPVRMAVNISPLQLRHGNLLDCIQQSISMHGIEASDFEIEITEGVMMADVENTILILRKIRAAGIRIALDDFGTGYSSLSYLNKFPIDKIKIDQSFVKNVTSSEEDASLARVIVSMAKSLNIPAIAEGIETEEQYKFVEDTGCDQAQGYFIAKPMPAEQVLERYGAISQDAQHM